MQAALRIETRRGADPPDGWAALADAAGHPSLVHSPLWHRALAAHLPGVTSAWALARRDGRPVGGVSAVLRARGPLLHLSGHFEGLPADPVVVADESDPVGVGEALLAALERLAPAWRGLGAAWHLGPEWGDRLASSLVARGHRAAVEPVAVLPLTGEPEHYFRERATKSRRQERDQGLARGAVTGASRDPAVLDEFAPLYAEAAQRWGIRPQPTAFLAELLADGEGPCFLTTVRAEGELIGAHFNFQDGERIVAWIGASRFDRKRLHPATLLIWADILEGERRGARWLDLGGHGGLAGVEAFKRHFGVDSYERHRFARRHPLLERLRPTV